MGSICADQQHHKFHLSHINKKLFREIDIPPRMFLSRRAVDSDNFMDSPKVEEAFLHKFLPCNNIVEDDNADPYSSDHFRIYQFKVRKCTRSRSHDWTDCPFAHPDEKARRRDPRKYQYSGTLCPEFRRGHCSRGDNCEFAHGVFECWLHPSRYRTESCKDGRNCKRKICFFAHTPRQLRLLPNENPLSPMNSPSFVGKKIGNKKPCCAYCHSLVCSPKSTSSPMSPSSPAKHVRFSPVSLYKDQFGHVDAGGVFKYGFVHSLEAMQLNYEPTSDPVIGGSSSIPWVNVNFNGEDHTQAFSSPSSCTNKLVGGGNFSNKNLFEGNENNFAEPDLGWVNDLLV